MKRSILFALLAILAACASGGGGGGDGGGGDDGGGSGDPQRKLPKVTMTQYKADDLDGVTGDIVANAASYFADFGGTGIGFSEVNGDTIRIASHYAISSYDFPYTADIKITNTDGSPYSKAAMSNGSDLYVAIASPASVASASGEVTFNGGTLKTKDAKIDAVNTIIFGGEGVKGASSTKGLEYSTFGMWVEDYHYTTDTDANPGYSSADHYKLHLFPVGDSSKKANFAAHPSEPAVFTGSAVAFASTQNPNTTVLNPDSDKAATVYGNAKLTLSRRDDSSFVSSTHTNKLELDFANFYKFTFEYVSGGTNTGAISAAPNVSNDGLKSLTIENNGNTTGINFVTGNQLANGNAGTNYTAQMSGQMYGPTAANPTEAAGAFSIIGANGRLESLYGVYGVKR